ncbi:MAG: hypothetical protein HY548_01120, partial [Elusimicrobia bacterium]|nr:hypothetical protein [Elusimicrobiota bacterium]
MPSFVLDLSSRVTDRELMDHISYPPAVVRRTLRFLELTNRFFGGIPLVLDFFELWSARWDRDTSIEILDVGTGGADIPR